MTRYDATRILTTSLVSDAMPVAVYTPESKLRRPVRLFREMWRDVAGSRGLAWQLFIRDQKASYRSSYLGVCWSVIPALLAAFLCTIAGHSKVVTFAATAVPFPAFVMLGVLLWQVFTEALNAPIQGIAREAAMFTKVKVPPEAVILAKLAEVVLNSLIKLCVAAFIIAYFRLPLTAASIFAPLAACSLILLGTFIGALLTPISLLYDDFVRFLMIGTGYWFLITPVVYIAPKVGLFSVLVSANPVTPLLVTSRELLTGATLSCLPAFLTVTVVSLVGMLLSWLLFKLSMPFVVERKMN